MSEYFPKPRPFGEKMKFELDSSNYATKGALKKRSMC